MGKAFPRPEIAGAWPRPVSLRKGLLVNQDAAELERGVGALLPFPQGEESVLGLRQLPEQNTTVGGA